MKLAISVIALALVAAGIALAAAPAKAAKGTSEVIEKVVKTDEEWKKILTPEQFNVLRKEGTERAFTSPLNHNHEKGVYVCAACGLPLFSSDTKFDSGTGWPSFWAPIDPSHVTTKSDRSFFMDRTEVRCARCGGHLGHVFPDGPKPTGLRYCMNGVSLKFEPAK
ncbi:MAG TPA: peptide-methionine (R)-S-oxide reductase MsrB [Thermoanaerobaculia bacterium]|jgi:peptide-methionine (R)-S-oxide reductase|nr:peptide-methionine (R)-S-oxide reductase MsrB [Thermoanaerobaculia bacterium]